MSNDKESVGINMSEYMDELAYLTSELQKQSYALKFGSTEFIQNEKADKIEKDLIGLKIKYECLRRRCNELKAVIRAIHNDTVGVLSSDIDL
jgi:hypothetical protein